jgi:hypothetical protein
VIASGFVCSGVEEFTHMLSQREEDCIRAATQLPGEFTVLIPSGSHFTTERHYQIDGSLF